MWNPFIIDPSDNNFALCNYCAKHFLRGEISKSYTKTPLNKNLMLKNPVRVKDYSNEMFGYLVNKND